jgi:hypothetical protein
MGRFYWILALVLAITLAVLPVSASGGTPTIARAPITVSGAAPIETLENGSAVAVASSTFWAVDGHTDCSRCIATQPEVGAFLNDSPIRWVRYGALSDRCNLTANVWYSDAGVAQQPCPSNLTAFKAWCDSTVPQCHAILTLPGENNNSAEDAAIAAWVVRTVGFQPDYWSIGNEPTGWTHFGIPWTKWSTADHSTPTPLAYAIDVRNAIAAVTKVDPGAKFIGIQAACACDTQWFSEVAHVDGAQISAISYHSYPSPGQLPNETLAEFYSPLSGSSNITTTFSKVRAAVLSGCSSCGRLPIEIGEYNAGPSTGASPYDGTFADAVFLAASVTQALRANVSALDVFDLQSEGSSYGYALMNAQGTPDAAGLLFSKVLGHLAVGTVYAEHLSPSISNVWTVLTQNSTTESLLVVNTNLAEDMTLDLGTTFSAHAVGQVVSWNSTSSQPLVGAAGPIPTSYSVPAQSILLVETATSGTAPSGPPAPPTGLAIDAITDGTVALSWQNPLATAVVNDTLFQGTSCGDWTRSRSLGTSVGTIAVGLAPETTYCFAVADWTTAGESNLSATIIGATTSSPGGPPTGLTISAATQNTIALTWENPATATVLNDTLLVGTSCGEWTQYLSVGVSTSTVVPNLSPETAYCFAVADWTLGGESNLSATVAGKTADAPPGSPANLSVRQTTPDSVLLGWTNPVGGLSGNTIYYGTTCGDWVELYVGATTEDNVTGLASQTNYCFTVGAAVGELNGPQTGPVWATTLAPQIPPSRGTGGPPGGGSPPGGSTNNGLFGPLLGLPGLDVIAALTVAAVALVALSVTLNVKQSGRRSSPRATPSRRARAGARGRSHTAAATAAYLGPSSHAVRGRSRPIIRGRHRTGSVTRTVPPRRG